MTRAGRVHAGSVSLRAIALSTLSLSSLSLGVIAVALALPPSAASAQREERFSTDVYATAGYSNNPFTVTGDDTGSALFGIDVAPRYQILTQRSTVTLSGDANLQQYVRRYGRNDSYSGAIDYQLRPSEQVTAHTRLDLSSSVQGAFGGYRAPVTGIGLGGTTPGTGTTPGETVPVTPPTSLVPITDVGLFGLRNRRRTAQLSGDVSLGLSARDSLTVSGYAEATRYNSLPLFGNYNAYGGSLGYSRRVSDRLSVGLRGSTSSYDYRAANSDSRVYPIEATASGRLSPLWTIDGSLGATIVDSDGIGSTRKTSLSGSVNLCRQGELSTMCVQASRQVTPTGLVGTQYVTSAGVNWSKQLSERETLSFNASYSKVGGGNIPLLVVGGVPIGGVNGLPLQTEYAQASVGYNRRISQRLGFVASANYRQLIGNNAGRPKDFGGQIGLSYRIGDTR